MQATTSLFLLIAAFALAAATAPPSENGWFVPQQDGSSFAWVSQEQFATESMIQPRAVAVTFNLYTKSNPNSPRVIPMNDGNALASSNFNKAHPTRFIIHGWGGDITADVNGLIRAALLATGSYNVFVVDWSANAQTANYNSARNSVPAVGQTVGKFIDFLNSKGGMSFGSLNVIGHSLGAHVAGFAGKSASRGRVHTIVGLDPAMPLFSYADCSTRLCSTDAAYVESIQTNGGTLGFLQPIGKASFYPNGGKSQPGCGVDLGGGCAHARSCIYYAESIRRNDFPSMKCGTYESAVSKDCGSTYSSVRMGAASNYGVSGYYYVPVKSTEPYGYGA